MRGKIKYRPPSVEDRKAEGKGELGIHRKGRRKKRLRTYFKRQNSLNCSFIRMSMVMFEDKWGTSIEGRKKSKIRWYIHECRRVISDRGKAKMNMIRNTIENRRFEKNRKFVKKLCINKNSISSRKI